MKNARRILWLIFALVALSAQPLLAQTVEFGYAPIPEGTGGSMFSALLAHPNGKIYMGTCNDVGKPAHFLEFDPQTKTVRDLGDMQTVTGEHDPELIAQSKIHTQLVVDKDGKIWFGTHCEERYTFPDGGLSQWEKGYSGGHMASYDPNTGKFVDHGILFPRKGEYPKNRDEFGESFISEAIDPTGQFLYLITDPGLYFVVYDTQTNSWFKAGTIPAPAEKVSPGYASPRDLEVAADGKVYIFADDGELICYNPETKVLGGTGVWLPGSDGKKENHPFQTTINPSGTKIYGSCSLTGHLFEAVVESGKKPVINDLGPAFDSDVTTHVIHALTFGLDGKLYYTPDWGGKLYTYDPSTHTKSTGRSIVLAGVPDGVDQSAWAAATAKDGTIYFAGIAGAKTTSVAFMYAFMYSSPGEW